MYRNGTDPFYTFLYDPQHYYKTSVHRVTGKVVTNICCELITAVEYKGITLT
jgi:hypothetical protein